MEKEDIREKVNTLDLNAKIAKIVARQAELRQRLRRLSWIWNLLDQ